MNDYSEHIQLPSDFFSKTLKEYRNWRFAWFRETIQNAADAGATQIDFTITELKSALKLTVQDNGHGLDKRSLTEGLLTLGGSIKQQVSQKEDKTIGGFGYAKHIILFAHQQYQIDTQGLRVSGTGIQYAVTESSEYLKGTKISVFIDKTATKSELINYCRHLIRNYQTNIKFSVNSRAVRTSFTVHEFEFDTELGRLRFSEEESNDVIFWIRVHGLPMFKYHLINRVQKGFFGTLDLEGEPTELLTANRDGLNQQASDQLKQLMYELVEQQHLFKHQHELKIIFNPIDDRLEDPHADVASVLPFSVPDKIMFNKKLIVLINQIQEPDLVITYPDHFNVHIMPILLRRDRYQHNQVTLPDVKHSLYLKRSQLLAWCWYYAVQWILNTDFIQYCLDIEFDDENNRHIIQGSENTNLIVSTGFIFCEAIEGLNIRTDSEIKIMINPTYIDADWMIGDVLDIAIHECAHCIAFQHDETFNDVELQIRRILRRTIDEDEILDDAKAMLDDLQCIVSE